MPLLQVGHADCPHSSYENVYIAFCMYVDAKCISDIDSVTLLFGCIFPSLGRIAAECTNMPELVAIIQKGYVSPSPPTREKTILDIIPENDNPSNTPVMEELPNIHPTYIEREQSVTNNNNPPMSPRAPASPRYTTSQQSRRANKLKPRANNPHTTELQPVSFARGTLSPVKGSSFTSFMGC